MSINFKLIESLVNHACITHSLCCLFAVIIIATYLLFYANKNGFGKNKCQNLVDCFLQKKKNTVLKEKNHRSELTFQT